MISQSAPRALEGSPSANTGLAFIVTAVNKPDVLKAFLQPVTGLGNCYLFIGCWNQIKIKLKFNSPHNFLHGSSGWQPWGRANLLLLHSIHHPQQKPPEASCSFYLCQKSSVGAGCSCRESCSSGQDERTLGGAWNCQKVFFPLRLSSGSPWWPGRGPIDIPVMWLGPIQYPPPIGFLTPCVGLAVATPAIQAVPVLTRVLSVSLSLRWRFS